MTNFLKTLVVVSLFGASVGVKGASLVNGTLSPSGGGSSATLSPGQSNQVIVLINNNAPTNGGINAAQAATQINSSNTTVFANAYIKNASGAGTNTTIGTLTELNGATKVFHFANGSMLRSNTIAPNNWEFHNTNGIIAYGSGSTATLSLDNTSGNVTVFNVNGQYKVGSSLYGLGVTNANGAYKEDASGNVTLKKVYAQTNNLPLQMQTDTDAEHYRFDYGPGYGDFNFGGFLGNGLMLSLEIAGTSTNVEFAISDKGPVYLPWGLVAQTNSLSNDAFGNPMTNAILAQGNVTVVGKITGNGSGLNTLVTAPSAGHTNIVMENSSGALIPYDLASLPSGGGSQTPWLGEENANTNSLVSLSSLTFVYLDDSQKWSLIPTTYGALLTSATTNGGIGSAGGLQTDWGVFHTAVIATNDGSGIVSVFNTNSITSPTITSPNFVGNGAGLTNLQSTNVVGLLSIGVLGANSHLKTDSITNLIGSEDATGYTNTVWYTNYLATTNVPIVFNYPASLCQGKITNGPNVFITFGGGDRGSWSFRVKTNVTLHLPPQISWLTGSNSVITNGVLSFTAYGGTNDVEASMRENQ